MVAVNKYQMSDVVIQKLLAGTGALLTIVATYIAQSGILEKGFDQLFSIGLLMVAVWVIWKAFNKKDESETSLLEEKHLMYKQQAELYREEIKTVKEYNEHLKQEIQSLKAEINESKRG